MHPQDFTKAWFKRERNFGSMNYIHAEEINEYQNRYILTNGATVTHKKRKLEVGEF
jgi:hypothetical protein